MQAGSPSFTSVVAGSLQLASFNAIIGLPVVPAAPTGSLDAAPHVGKGAIQLVITRQTTEPGDDLTATPCPYNYPAGQPCMPTVAGTSRLPTPSSMMRTIGLARQRIGRAETASWAVSGRKLLMRP